MENGASTLLKRNLEPSSVFVTHVWGVGKQRHGVHILLNFKGR